MVKMLETEKDFPLVKWITVLVSNTRTLKFKSQRTVSFLAAANVIADVSGNDASRKMVQRSCLVDFDPLCQFLFLGVQYLPL